MLSSQEKKLLDLLAENLIRIAREQSGKLCKENPPK